MSRQAVGPPSHSFKEYRDSSLGAKLPRHGTDYSSQRLRLKMSGAVPLLPHYVFMA